jgi:hypothetical protein
VRVLLISANTLTTPYPFIRWALTTWPMPFGMIMMLRLRTSIPSKDMEPLRQIMDSFDPGCCGNVFRNIDNTDQTDQKSFIAGYRELARIIRSHTKATLVLGGSGFTLFPEEMMAVSGCRLRCCG